MTTLMHFSDKAPVLGTFDDHGLRDGERLGLYELMARAGPLTVYGLARAALLPVAYAYRWLDAQARAGYLHVDPFTARYSVACELWCEWPRSPDTLGGPR